MTIIIKNKILFLTFVLIFITIQSNAQNNATLRQIVRGRVLDKQTLTPIEYANVVISSDSKQLHALTDFQGNFTINDVAVGRCGIMVSILGYSEYSVDNILVYSGKETVIEVALEAKVVEMAEIVVTSKTNKEIARNQMVVASARLLSTEEANRYAGSWSDPARMASNLAGVVAANDSRNDIVIRGNSPMGLLWRLDGFEIANPNHFGSMAGSGGNVGMINNNQLSNSDFYTGAFPAEFGNVTSGIFDLRLRNGNNHKHEFLLSLGFNGFEVGAEGPLSKKTGASYIINARYSFLDILNKIGLELSETKGAIPEYQDLCFKINIPLAKGNLSFVNLIGGSHINLKDDMTDENEWMVGDKGQDVDMRNRQLFTGANYTYRFNEKTRLENRLSLQTFQTMQDIYSVEYPSINREMKYKSNMIESRIGYTSALYKMINTKNYINAGVGVNLYLANLHDQISRQSQLSTLHDGQNNSMLINSYVQWKHRFNDNISIIPGIHGNYYTYTQDYSLEPRLGFQWKMSPAFTFNMASGLYSQMLPRQVYFYKDNGKSVNEDLKMMRSFQTVAGFDLKLATSLRLKVEAYYQYLYNIPVIPLIPEESILNLGDDYQNNWDYDFVNKGTGYNYGLDITLEKFFDRNYYFLLTASLYNSTYKGYDGVERNTKYNGNYSLNCLGGYEWKLNSRHSLSVNTKVSLLGGKRYIPAVVTSTMVMEREYDYSQAYTNKLSDYFKIDLNLNLKTNYRKVALEWFFEINNVTNHKNIWMQYHDTNHDKERYIYQQGLMPMGGVRIYL